MSSRGYEVDLIESICDNIALSGHLEELLREEPGENTHKILEASLTTRREQMSRLLEMADKPNPKLHCCVKHALGAWWKHQEVYEATLDEKDYLLAKRLGDIAAMCLSQYLGLEFETCQRCLYDSLLTKTDTTVHSKLANLQRKLTSLQVVNL